MKWKDCVKEGVVRKSFHDKERAKSLSKEAKERIDNYAGRIKIDDMNARFVVEEYYESIIELVHALMSLKGFRCYSHDCAIEFLREFFPDIVSENEINFLHRFRILRNGIKYKGENISKQDALKWISRSKGAFGIIERLLKENLSGV